MTKKKDNKYKVSSVPRPGRIGNEHCIVKGFDKETAEEYKEWSDIHVNSHINRVLKDD